MTGICSLVVIWTVAVTMLAAQAQKPVVELPLMIDYYNVPTTLDGLVDKADAGVIGRIDHAANAPVNGRARTRYDVHVLKTLKEHSSLGRTIVVCRPIGTVEQKDRIVKAFQPHFPSFQGREEYLLLLHWDNASSCYFPLYGATSVGKFGIDGRMKAVGAESALHALNGLEKADVAAHVHAARSRR